MAIWPRIKTAISNSKAVLSILGWLGLSASVSAVLATVGGGIWAVITGVPLPLVLMTAFCTFTGGVYLALAPMAYRALLRIQDSPAKTRPDPEIWRHLPNLQLYEAACLLADIDPDFPVAEQPGDANGWFRALCEAVRSKEISRVESPSDNRDHFRLGSYHPHRETVITREALQEFAAKRGLRRAFLANT